MSLTHQPLRNFTLNPRASAHTYISTLHMFVLPVSDHVGLVLGLEQAPGFRTHDYLIGTLSVHVEVKSLLGLLSVGDLDFPSFGCELAAAGVGFAGHTFFSRSPWQLR